MGYNCFSLFVTSLKYKYFSTFIHLFINNKEMCVFIFIYFVLFDCFSSLLSLPLSSLLLTPSTLDVWVDSTTPSEDLTWMPPWFKPGMQGPTQVLRAEVMTSLIFFYSRDVAHVNILMLRHQKYYLHRHHKLSSIIYLASKEN